MYVQIPPWKEWGRTHLHSREMNQAGCQDYFCFAFPRDLCSMASLDFSPSKGSKILRGGINDISSFH